MSAGSPFTVALPRRFRTAFPILPRGAPDRARYSVFDPLHHSLLRGGLSMVSDASRKPPTPVGPRSASVETHGDQRYSPVY